MLSVTVQHQNNRFRFGSDVAATWQSMDVNGPYYRPHPKDEERYCFQFVCQFTPRGGVPHPRSGWGGTPSQVWMGGYPISGLRAGYPIPGLDGGVPHLRSGQGYPIPDLDGGYPIPGLDGGGLPHPRSGWGVPGVHVSLWNLPRASRSPQLAPLASSLLPPSPAHSPHSQWIKWRYGGGKRGEGVCYTMFWDPHHLCGCKGLGSELGVRGASWEQS